MDQDSGCFGANLTGWCWEKFPTAKLQRKFDSILCWKDACFVGIELIQSWHIRWRSRFSCWPLCHKPGSYRPGPKGCRMVWCWQSCQWWWRWRPRLGPSIATPAFTWGHCLLPDLWCVHHITQCRCLRDEPGEPEQGSCTAAHADHWGSKIVGTMMNYVGFMFFTGRNRFVECSDLSICHLFFKRRSLVWRFPRVGSLALTWGLWIWANHHLHGGWTGKGPWPDMTYLERIPCYHGGNAQRQSLQHGPGDQQWLDLYGCFQK